MNALLIVIVALVALVIFVKAKEVKHHLVYKILGVIGVLFALSLAYIWMGSGFSLTTYEGFLGFGRTYFVWLSNLFGNARGVTGYVVQQGWGINSTVVP